MSLTAFTYTISDRDSEKEDSIKGDEKAFENLFKLYYVKLSFFANKFVNDIDVSGNSV